MISTTDGKRSKRFYDQLFQQLNWKTIDEGDDYAGYSDGNFTLWVVPAENQKDSEHHFKSVGFHHFSIRVEERSEVDSLFEWCTANNITVVDEPKEYPEYNEGYYAVFFLDPDGMKLEVTYLSAESQIERSDFIQLGSKF